MLFRSEAVCFDQKQAIYDHVDTRTGLPVYVWQPIAWNNGNLVYDAHAYAIALGFYPLLIGAGHVLAYALRETQTR